MKKIPDNILFSAAIISVIMLPILSYGYVMTFDMAWGEIFPTTTPDRNYWLLFHFLHEVQNSIPAWIVQKIVLCSIIICAAASIRYLLKTIAPVTHRFLYLFASLLYIFNPFFYTRFITGQWLVLMGYALLPFAIGAYYKFLRTPSLRTALPVTCFLVAISLTSIHTIGIALLALVCLSLYSGFQTFQKKIKWTIVIAAVWAIVNATWLLPLATDNSDVGDSIKNFASSEMEAFATHGTIVDSPALSATLLTGFWADDTNRYILPSSLAIWWIGVLCIAVLVVTGIVRIIQKKDKLGYTFIAMGAISWILGIGIAWSITAPVTELLIKLIPFYNGYREPHKWLMLLTIVYVYLATTGANYVYVYVQKNQSIWIRYGIVTILAVSPFLYAPSLAWGAAGQLRSTPYPNEWQQAKTYLNSHTSTNTAILVLPWHMYLPISFTGRVVPNPASYYFEQKLVTGNNFEMKGVADQNNTSLTRYINRVTMLPSDQIHGFSENLNSFNIKYVLLLKESDWNSYAWLESQGGIKPVMVNNKLIIYEIMENM